MWYDGFMSTGLTRAQYDYLIARIRTSRVNHLRGQSHLEAWDVRRHLTRIFGFTGWSDEIIECSLVREIEYPPGAITYNNGGSNTKTAWTVVYRVQLRLIIRDTDGDEIGRWEDGACGDAVNQPSLGDAHDLAMKTALSQALKRCAVNLGDQFGLGLYNDGKTDPVVNQTLVAPGEPVTTAKALESAAAADAPVVPEPAADPTTEPAPITESAPEAQPETPTEPRPETDQDMVRQDNDSVRTTPELPMSPAQRSKIFALWRDIGWDGREKRSERLAVMRKLIGSPALSSTTELSYNQASAVIQGLQAKREYMRRHPEAA